MFFSEAKKGKNEFWRFIISVILIIAVTFIGQIPLIAVFLMKMTDYSQLEKFQEDLDFSHVDIDPNVGLILILIPFALCFLSMIFIVRLIHERDFKTVLTAHERFNWTKMFFSIFLMLILLSASELILYLFNPGNYELNFNMRLFIPLIIIAIILLPLQTSFEEILMRGYLMQGIGLISRYKWIPLVITSVLFGLLHIMNPEIKEFGLLATLPYYIGFGLFMGIVVIMDDGLEIPLGIHAAVNIYGTAFVTFSGSTMQTPALFRMKEYDPAIMNILSVFIAFVFLAIAAKKYKWAAWKKIFERIK
jgi:membrane protease YdiL (CAAX protease family)